VSRPAGKRARIDRQRLGSAAEERAVQLLRQAGYAIVARNFRCRMGELDIIAQQRRIRRSGS
jgi:putative endonuclease